MPRPALFVGASSEGLDIARKVRAQLKHDAEVTLWTDDVFRLNESALDGLFRQLQLADFAALVLTPDDLTESRGRTSESPRDNILLELGLFLGHLGRRRTFAIYDSDRAPKVPSDLLGITLATYKGNRADGNLMAAVGEACDLIRESMQAERLRLRPIPPATSIPQAPSRRKRACLVWVVGSYGSLNDQQRHTAERLLSPLAAGLMSQGFRVVMGESEMLLELARKCRDASLTGSTESATTMLFVSLRRNDIDAFFKRAVGAQPDIALVVGGNTDRGRTREELSLAVGKGIPILSVPATGGVAAETASTVTLSGAEQTVLQKAWDVGDLSKTILSVVARIASQGIGRKPRSGRAPV